MSAALARLAPLGIPAGVDPRTWREAIETRLNEILDESFALITALDIMEVDPDFEPCLGAAENHPGGYRDNSGQADWYARQTHSDREDENEHGGDILDEPHDGEEREADDGDYDAPGFIWGGNEAAPRNHPGNWSR